MLFNDSVNLSSQDDSRCAGFQELLQIVHFSRITQWCPGTLSSTPPSTCRVTFVTESLISSMVQIIGSGVAMYMISPTLTAALLGCLPLVFFVGSLIGGQLRRLSHNAHEKVGINIPISSI